MKNINEADRQQGIQNNTVHQMLVTSKLNILHKHRYHPNTLLQHNEKSTSPPLSSFTSSLPFSFHPLPLNAARGSGEALRAPLQRSGQNPSWLQTQYGAVSRDIQFSTHTPSLYQWH